MTKHKRCFLQLLQFFNELDENIKYFPQIYLLKYIFPNRVTSKKLYVKSVFLISSHESYLQMSYINNTIQ